MNKLKDARQHVECQSCGQVFLDMDAYEYERVSLCHKNRGIQPNYSWYDLIELLGQIKEVQRQLSEKIYQKGLYDKFFINAVKHWCEYPDHTIIVTVPNEALGGQLQTYDLTFQLKMALNVYGTDYITATKILMDNAYYEGAVI